MNQIWHNFFLSQVTRQDTKKLTHLNEDEHNLSMSLHSTSMAVDRNIDSENRWTFLV